MTSTAQRLNTFLGDVLGGPPPVRLRAWDGTESGGPPHAPVVVVRSRRALRRLLWQPGELGLTEAYISGDIDIEGDVADALQALWQSPVRHPAPTAARLARAAVTAAGLGALGPRPPAPAGRARPRGTRHTTTGDRATTSRHHDLAHDFYALLLGPSMAYSCGYWAGEDPAYDLEQAQRDKLELICRKLALRPGSRLLDIGCGWGSLALYAAEHHKVQVTAVTLAQEQHDVVRARTRERGLDGLIDVQLGHYRDIKGGQYEAVTAVETGEHVGDEEYADFATLLYRMLRPQGRLLVQQKSRGTNAPGGTFIESCVAPVMHTRPPGQTITLLEDAGFEVRSVEALREHYVRTIAAWHRRLEDHWGDFVALAGREAARGWRLHLVGGALAFEAGRMGVEQILAVRPSRRGSSGMPAAPATWYRTDGES